MRGIVEELESKETFIEYEDSNILLEKKRKQLLHIATTKGLSDSQTLRISAELDVIVLSVMKENYE